MKSSIDDYIKEIKHYMSLNLSLGASLPKARLNSLLSWLNSMQHEKLTTSELVSTSKEGFVLSKTESGYTLKKQPEDKAFHEMMTNIRKNLKTAEQDLELIGTIETDLVAYNERLKKLHEEGKLTQTAYNMYQRISPSELILQYKYILENALFFEMMSPGDALHFSKGTTKLPRTFTVVHHEGHINIFLATKSKLATLKSQKNKLEEAQKDKATRQGAEKQGKTCYLISSTQGPEEYMAMRSLEITDQGKIDGELVSTLHPFSTAAELTRSLGMAPHPGGLCAYMNENQKIKFVGFSPLASGDLGDILYEESAGLSHDAMSPLDRLELLRQILLQIEILHSKSLVHLDIKPQNILFFLNKDGTGIERVKLIDLTRVVELDKVEPRVRYDLLTTITHAPSEVFMHYSDRNSSYYDSFWSDQHYFCLGRELADKVKNRHSGSFKTVPAKSIDMWSFGILAYQVLYGHLPLEIQERALIARMRRYIKKDPLLASLLKENPEERITVEQALEQVEKRIEQAKLGKTRPENLLAVLFAQIHNDSWRINITPDMILLEDNLEYFIDFLEKNQDKFKEAKELNEIFRWLITVRKKIPVYESAEIANDILNRLQEKGVVYMPGGWDNISETHDMIYAFEKTKSGDVLFKIYNSGIGLDAYHLKVQGTDKERSCVIQQYLIPKEFYDKVEVDPESNSMADTKKNAELLETNRRKMLWFITEIIKPTQGAPRENPYTADSLYKVIFPKILMLNAKLVISPTDPCFLTVGQRSKTSSQKILNQLVKTVVNNKREYKRLMYEFKKHTLNEYVKTLSEERRSDTMVQREITLAIANMARLLRKESYFTEKERIQENKYLAEVSEMFSRRPLNKASHSTRNEKNNLATYMQFQIDAKESGEKEKSFNAETPGSIPHQINVAHVVPSFAWSDNMQNKLPIFLEKLEEISRINPDGVLENIEKFFMGIELSLKINDEIVDEICSQLFSLYKLYNKIYLNLNRTIQTPRYCVTALSYLTIVGRLQGIEGAYRNELSTWLSSEQSNPFYGSQELVCDQRLEEIRKYFARKNVSESQDYLDYFCSSVLPADMYHKLVGAYEAYAAEEIKKKGESFYGFRREYLPTKKATAVCVALLRGEYEDDALRLKDLKTLFCDRAIKESRLKAVIADIVQKEPRIMPKFTKLQNGDSGLFFATFESMGSMPLYHIDSIKKLGPTLASKNVSTCQMVLENPPVATNQIMIASEGPNWLSPKLRQELSAGNEAAKILQALFASRSSKALQICNTFKFFSKNCHLTKDPEYQFFLEKNIFEPGLLKKWINRKPDYLKTMNEFIWKGANYFTEDGIPTKTTVFYLTLGVKINNYVKQILSDKEDKNTHETSVYLTQIKEKTDHFLKKQNLSDEVSTLLHRARILILSQCKELTQNDIQLYFESLIYNYYHPIEQQFEDLQDKEQLSRAIRHISEKIFKKNALDKTSQKTIEEAVARTIEEIGKNVEDFWYDFQETLLYVRKKGAHESSYAYKINLTTGLISNASGLQKQPLPEKIRKNTHVIALLGSQLNKAWQNVDGSIFVIETDDASYKIHQISETNYELSRQFGDLSSWYELMSSPPKFSPFILAKTHHFWSHENLIYATDKHSRKPEYVYNRETKKWALLKDDLSHAGCILTDDSPLHAIFKDFEDARFVEVICVNEKTYQAKFLRYNLEVEINVEGEKLEQWKIYRRGVNELLCMEPKEELIAGLKTPLRFVEQSSGRETLILPRQKFVRKKNDESRMDGDTLILDTSDYRRDSWYKENRRRSSEVSFRSKSEVFYAYSLKDENIIPSTMEQGLYLIYCFLAKKQTKQAFKMIAKLNEQFTGLKGTAEEIENIRWILETKFDHEYWPIHLRILILLSKFKRENPRHKFAPLPQSKRDHQEDAYEIDRLEKNNKVYENIHALIYETYNRYHSEKNNLSAEFDLNEDERFVLLRVCVRHGVKLEGPIDLEWRRLQRLQCDKERWHLLQKEGLSPNERTRLEELYRQQQELQQQPIRQKVPSIETTGSGHGLPEEPRFPLYVLQTITDGYPKSSKLNQKEQKELLEKINDLFNPEVALICLRYNLKSLIMTLSGMDTDSEFIKALSSFCQIKLQSISRWNTEPRSLLLYKILYIVSQEPAQFVFNEQPKSNSNKNIRHEVQTWLDEIYKKARKIEQEKRYLSSIRVQRNATEDSFYQITWEPNSEESRLSITPDKVTQYESFQKLLPALEKFISDYNKLGEKSQRTLRPQPTTDLDLEDQDLEEGRLQNEIKKKQEVLASTFFTTQKRGELKKNLASKIPELEEQIQKERSEIFFLANSCDDVSHQLAIKGKQKPEISEAILLKLYMRADKNQYREATGLSDEHAIESLHHKIGKFLWDSQNLQQLKKADKLLDDIGYSDEVTPESGLKCAELASLITAVNHVDPNTEPTLMIFQYLEEILLREQQKHYLNRLLTKDDQGLYHSEIIQLIMGGGKTKVLLPLLALKKANGDNLSVIEFPQELFETNYSDLSSTSVSRFNQTPYKLLFDRSAVCDARTLEMMYQDLDFVRVSSGYVVTTNASIRSLMMKYLEFLNQDNPDAEQIRWLGEILKLLQSSGDALIDEIDTALSVRLKFNYTLGEPQTVPKEQIEDCLAILKFLDECKVSVVEVEALPQIVDSFFSEKNSPIASLCVQLDHSKKKALKDYLLNASNTATTAFEFELDRRQKSLLALVKQQLNVLLPMTSQRKAFEHFGPSQDKTKTPEERAVAVPYSGNNVCRDNYKFGNYLETINYTVMFTMQTGITKELLVNLLKKFKAEAKNELSEQDSQQTDSPTLLDETPSGKLISRVLKKKLSTIDLLNHSDLNKLVSELNRNKEFLFFVLEQAILPHITYESQMLKSNAQNHRYCYRTLQGVTGTPWNYTTLPIPFDPGISLGTDGITVDLLKSKKTLVHAALADTPLKFLEASFKQLKDKKIETENVRAIIDIGAFFRGISNEAAAKQIAKFFTTHDPSIKFILYFKKNPQGNDMLYAIDRGNKEVPPICIGSSDKETIRTMLRDCSPENRFTYYDQSHCIGTDILQSSQAKALMTVDAGTLKKDLLQAVMRMRGLSAGQTVEMFVDEETAKTAHDIEKLINLTSENQKKCLLRDNFQATIEKMQNVLRQAVMNKILAVTPEDIKTKKEIFLKAKDHFVAKLDTDIFELYGKDESLQEVAQVLEAEKKRLLEEARKLDFEDEVFESMKKQITEIVSQSIKLCPEQVYHKTNAFSQVVQTEQQHQRQEQQQQQQQQQQEQEQEQTTVDRRPREFDRWATGSTIDTLKSIDFSKSPHCRLNKFLPNCSDVPKFHANIYCSTNFVHTVAHHIPTDDNAIPSHAFIKPVSKILMRYTKDGVEAMLVTSEEAEELMIAWNRRNKDQDQDKDQDKHLWLIDSDGDIIEGEVPELPEKQKKTYKDILEQIKIYAGDFSHFDKQDLFGSWLQKERNAVFDFLEQQIVPHRFINPVPIAKCETRLKQIDNAVNLILSRLPETTYLKKEEFNGVDFVKLQSFQNFLEQLEKADFQINEQNKQFFHSYCFKKIYKDTSGQLKGLREKYFEILKNTTTDAGQEVLRDTIKTSIEERDYELIKNLLLEKTDPAGSSVQESGYNEPIWLILLQVVKQNTSKINLLLGAIFEIDQLEKTPWESDRLYPYLTLSPETRTAVQQFLKTQHESSFSIKTKEILDAHLRINIDTNANKFRTYYSRNMRDLAGQVSKEFTLKDLLDFIEVFKRTEDLEEPEHMDDYIRFLLTDDFLAKFTPKDILEFLKENNKIEYFTDLFCDKFFNRVTTDDLERLIKYSPDMISDDQVLTHIKSKVVKQQKDIFEFFTRLTIEQLKSMIIDLSTVMTNKEFDIFLEKVTIPKEESPFSLKDFEKQLKKGSINAFLLLIEKKWVTKVDTNELEVLKKSNPVSAYLINKKLSGSSQSESEDKDRNELIKSFLLGKCHDYVFRNTISMITDEWGIEGLKSILACLRSKSEEEIRKEAKNKEEDKRTTENTIRKARKWQRDHSYHLRLLFDVIISMTTNIEDESLQPQLLRELQPVIKETDLDDIKRKIKTILEQSRFISHDKQAITRSYSFRNPEDVLGKQQTAKPTRPQSGMGLKS